MTCCNSSDCNLTSRTPLGLSGVFRVMANKWIDKVIQCSNLTMYNNLSQKARDYGAFDAYVIRHVGNIADQRLWAVDALHFLAWLSTCSAV